MADLSQIESAFLKADAAGDTQAAAALAAEIKRQRSGPSMEEKIAADPFVQSARNFAQDMPAGQQFAAGMGGAFQNIIDAGKQLVGAGPNAEQVRERRRLDAPLNATGAGLAGNVAVNIAALAPLSVVPGANTIGGAATIGALAGALNPTTGAGERLQNMGVGFGLGGGTQAIAQNPVAIYEGAKRALAGPARGVKAAVEPLYEGGRQQILSRALNDATGGNTPFVLNNLRNAQEIVPGSLPTAAESAQSGGIAAMQRGASAVDPEAYATRAVQQNEARTGSLLDLAGTTGQRDFYDAARKATAKQLYDEAYALGIDTTQMTPARKGEITKLLRTPAMQEAVSDARKLAMNEMKKVGDPAGSVLGLDYVKRALDDKIKLAQGNEARVLSNLKDRLLTTLDTLSPKYGEARTTFAAMSKPINQMDIAQAIADRSMSPLTGNLKPEMFARALSDDTAAKVTGMRNATLGGTMEPDQLARLNAIKEDLARAVQARDLGRGPGSDTTQKLAMTNLMQRSGLPMGVLRMPLAGRVGNWLYENADQRMREQLSQALLNPQETARLMAQTKPPLRIPEAPQSQRDIAALLARALVVPATLESQR